MAAKYPEIAREAAKARVIYDAAWADAITLITHNFVSTETKFTVPERDALATQKVREELETARMAEAELDAAKKYISVLEAILSSVQTRAKLVQMEWTSK